MAAKKFNAIRIQDPGEGHLVIVKPNQGFVITLSGDFPTPEVEFQSNYFKLIDSVIEDNSASFTFEQIFDLNTWSKISKVFLGEIFCLYSYGDVTKMGSVCVILDTNSVKSHYITVINPENVYLKVEPTNHIEIVLYDWEYLGEWGVRCHKGQDGVGYQKHSYHEVDTGKFAFQWGDNEDSFFAYPRAILFSKIPIKEHHFWFELDDFSKTNNLGTGVHNCGKIVFFKPEKGSCEKTLNIKLNIRANKTFEFKKEPLINAGIASVVKSSYVDSKPYKEPDYPRTYQQTATSYGGYIGIPKDSLLRHEISLIQKDDTDLHSDKIVYF